MPASTFSITPKSYANGVSEEIMGAALKKLGWGRGSYLISTKLFHAGLHEGPNQQDTLNRKVLAGGRSADR